MSSLAQLIADDKRMTTAEAADLLNRGFKDELVEFLRAHGFREAGDRLNGDRTTTATFLRQTHYPHIHIPVEPTDTIDDLLTAIYDAGYTDGSDRIATAHQKFIEAVQRPRRPSATDRSIEQRLAALEAKQSAVA
jgi:hypothetical protein